MNLDDADIELGYFQPVKKTVDQSVGFVLTALFVVFLFMALVGGIMHVQYMSPPDGSDAGRTSRSKGPDIGDLGPVTPETPDSQSAPE